MKRVDEADVLKGKMPNRLRTVWRGAFARPLLPDGRLGARPPEPKRKRAYYRALLRNEPWALQLKHYREVLRQFVKEFLSDEET